MNPNFDITYYANSSFGYCLPDGITLEIDGLPEDIQTKRFTLSIYNKLKTQVGNTEVKLFMQKYLPKFHFSNPQLDKKNH